MTEDLPLPDLPSETSPGVEATVSPPTDLIKRSAARRSVPERKKKILCLRIELKLFPCLAPLLQWQD